MNYGSLFSGIGGFDLGFERAGLTCQWQVEIDPFCRRVLAKHWPQVPRYDDVRTFATEETEGLQVDVVAGGFPCQDLSLAGKQIGIDGERSGLWSEFARIIRLLRPRYVVVENVPGLLVPLKAGEGDERQVVGPAAIARVLGNLAAIGYDAEWNCYCASDFGARHVRKRVIIVAYPAGHGDRFRVLPEGWRAEGERACDAERRAGHDAANAHFERSQAERIARGTQEKIADADGVGLRSGAAIDREPGGSRAPSQSGGCDSPFVGTGCWGAEPPLVRMVYGVSRGLVRDAICGLGNAVVPQLSEFIGRCLIEHSARSA